MIITGVVHHHRVLIVAVVCVAHGGRHTSCVFLDSSDLVLRDNQLLLLSLLASFGGLGIARLIIELLVGALRWIMLLISSIGCSALLRVIDGRQPRTLYIRA